MDERAALFYDKMHQGTQMSDVFFHPENINHLQKTLEQILSHQIRKNVRVPVNDEFMQTMHDVMSANPLAAYGGPAALQSLNDAFLKHEARILGTSLVQRDRYFKWIIDDDRMKVFPRPEREKRTKGDYKVVPSGYMLSNPWANQMGNYRKMIYEVGVYGTPSTERHHRLKSQQ